VARWRREPQPSFDPHELGARRSDPELAALQPIPDLFSERFSPKKLLLYFAAGVVLLGVVRTGSFGSGTALKTSCTEPGFSLSSDDVKQFGVVRWAATGPSDSRVVFALDTSTVPVDAEAGLLAAPPDLHGCKASGQFGVRASVGNHVVHVLSVAKDGTVTTVGTKKLAVEDP
jgi:hypothetical protein